MTIYPSMLRASVCAAGLFLCSLSATAGEKKLLHCFTFTAVEGATDADWQAFYKASDELPGKIPSVTKVWYGKLASPQTVYTADQQAAATYKSGAKTAKGEFTRLQRQYGMCMEMTDAAALKAYEADPGRKAWLTAYEKVRVAGTTTFNLLGQ